MSYMEESRQSYGSRISNAAVGIPMGLLMVLGSGAAVWWNEGRNVYTQKAIAAGVKAVVEAPCDEYSSELEGRLIHDACGLTHLKNFSLLGGEIRVDEAAFVKTTVEMYQWIEKSTKSCRKTSGGSKTCTTTYSYRRDWESTRINSAGFRVPDGHHNPTAAWPLQSGLERAPGLSVGVYALGDLASRLYTTASVPIPADWPLYPAQPSPTPTSTTSPTPEPTPEPTPQPMPTSEPTPTPLSSNETVGRRLQDTSILLPPHVFDRQTLKASGDSYLTTSPSIVIGAMRVSFERGASHKHACTHIHHYSPALMTTGCMRVR
jgi:hypothetical protein